MPEGGHMTEQVPAVVSTEWLADRINDPGVKIIASESETVTATGSSQAAVARDLRAEFEASHIPGAVLFNLDEISDPESELLMMLPPREQFSAQVSALGISNDDLVIVYDSQGVRTSPRSWWMFRVFGHDNVAVLDGGLPKWKREDRQIASGWEEAETCQFTAELRGALLLDVHQMMQIQADRTVQVVDGRPANRYQGTAPEPRGNIPSGRMPWSKSVPSDLVVNSQSGELFPLETIRTNFEAASVNIDQPIATTCGRGIAACQLALGLHLLSNTNAAIYDGSWLEWASREDTVIEKA
jgi:thiosulfate/3-mercaptopyruvate sulfurtransferase